MITYTSQLPLQTHRETPADAELASHRYMLRSGMIRKVAAGVYVWLPLGLRVLRKVEQIVRHEMNQAGAQELLMPSVQPAELWQESGRWAKYGAELLRFKDRHQRDFCLGPTHEEVITALVRNDIRSYKQLPVNFYQIQTKFRDEVRPRFGVLRGREFLMKDAYSFHLDDDCLAQGYQHMEQAYHRIFNRLGLRYRAVDADNGSIGGTGSKEFQVLADCGEDVVVYSDGSDYAANLELATHKLQGQRPPASQLMNRLATPNAHSIDDITNSHGIPAQRQLKILFVQGSEHPLVAFCLRGDHQLNPLKAEKLPQVSAPLTMASEDSIKQALGCPVGSLGPVNLPATIPLMADHDALLLADFTCGANEAGYHLTGVNWQRDCPEPVGADLRLTQAGDLSPDGQGTLHTTRGIEVGHIFQLGDQYSQAMQAYVLDPQGKNRALKMGCYGIGVSRLVAAAIEQCHDDKGICWNRQLAPWQVAILPLNGHRSATTKQAAAQLAQQCEQAGFDVLFDDRPLRPGVMFADMDLVGIPLRLVVSERLLSQQKIELKWRHESQAIELAVDELPAYLAQHQFSQATAESR